jgi:phage-related protein
MAEKQKTPLIFYRSASGVEPVREWLKSLPAGDRKAVGLDLMRAQWRWPVGMPLCRPLGQGLSEVRTDLRVARVLLCVSAGQLVALHEFIKKTQKTSDDDLKLARRRKKEIDQ